MTGGEREPVPDQRRGSRHPVDYPVIAEHRQHGDVRLHVVNISAHGFMVRGGGLARGDRVTIRLPVIGRIEAFVAWNTGERAGLQFERLLRSDDFARISEAIAANPARRGAG